MITAPLTALPRTVAVRPVRPHGRGRGAGWMAAVLVAVIAGVVGLDAVRLRAQEAAAEPRRELAAPRVGEVGPEIFYLQDDANRLVPVPGFSYRDFVELFRMREGLPAVIQPPDAVLENIVVALDLATTGPTCPATVTCTVRQSRAGWVHVPLDLEGLLITAPPRHEGPGRMMVDADPLRGGYRAWFDTKPDDTQQPRHTLVLEGVVAVDRQPSSAAVALQLPLAIVSRVDLRTDRVDPVVAVVPAPPQRIATTAAAAGSVVDIAGLSGNVRIRIADRGAAAGQESSAWGAVPQASVESLVRIDGRNASTEATIRLENLPPETAAVRVTLPPRTTLRGVRDPAAITARGGTDEKPHADIAIARDEAGRATIELQCERPVDPAAAKGQEILGFAVEQVVPWRQWGRVSLVVEGEWRAEWTVPAGIRRVDPPPTARRPGFVAAFAYDSQPAALPVRILPLRSRVVIEPEYRYDVTATRIGMQARLRVAARGAAVTGISLGLEPGWNIDDVGPAGVVDTTGWTSAGGKITIPFLQALSGDATIEIRGSRPLDRSAERLTWKLPVPQADLVGPAAVVVGADSDIEILPDAAAMRGLVRQAGSGQSRSDADGTALLYRLDTTEGVFAATRRFLPRRVDAAIAAQAAIDEAEIGVEESIRLTVEHVPLEYLELAVPETVIAGGSLEVRQDDTLLDPLDVGEAARDARSPTAGASPAIRCLRALLPVPLLGKGEILVRYRLPAPRIPPEATVAVDLPLVMPLEARIERQSIVLDGADALAVSVRGEAWKPEAGPAAAATTWATAKRHDAVPLAVAARPRIATGRAVVEAAWLRTHLRLDRREDRYSFVIDGAGERLTVTVPCRQEPDAADGVQCEVKIDGSPAAVGSRADGRFVLDLPPAAAGRRRLVEIGLSTPRNQGGWARLAAGLGMPELVSLEPPVFADGVTQRRFYWEIVTRADEHVCLPPTRWTAQQQWQWGPTGLNAEPVVSPAALGEWIGRTAGTTAAAGGAGPTLERQDPPLAGRRSVYSGVGTPGAATIGLMPTWCLVLVASGVSLACGLAFAYRPAARRPAVAVPVLATAAVAAAAAPDLGPLVAMAAAPGAVLSAVAWALRAWCDRDRSRRQPAFRGQVSSSSLTRSLPAPPSLIVSASAARGEGSVTAAGRQER